MELNGYRLLLPEGTLDYFDLVDVKESVNEVVFYLEEKNIVPEKYTDQDTESKGFYDPVKPGHSLNITKSANQFIHKVLRISWLFCIFRYSPENKI